MRDGGGDQLEGGRGTDVGRLLALTPAAFRVSGPWADRFAVLLVGGMAEMTGYSAAPGIAGFALAPRPREKKSGRSD